MFLHALLYLTLCGVTFTAAVESKLFRRPVNTAVRQGSSVTIECVTVRRSLVYWFNRLCYSSHACTRTDYIYNGHQLFGKYKSSQRFSVTGGYNATHVTRNLNINATELSDAGVYLCVQDIGRISLNEGQTSSAQLIIVGGDTICTTNLSASGAVQEYDVITMTCSITYSGNWAPVMRWFNSDTSRIFTDDVITMTTNETVISLLTVTSSAGLHGSKIVCVTHFTQPSPPLSTSATNVPSYTYTWTSPTLQLQLRYAPRNLQITPTHSTYEPGDKIECSAEGNPEPSYQWTNLVSRTVVQGAVLVISKDMVDKSHAYKCTGTNQYNGAVHENFTTISFSVMRTHDYKSAMIALAVIASISIVIIILLVLYIVKALRHHTHKDHHPQARHSAAATERTHPAGAEAYEELDMTSPIQPVYSHIRR